MIAAIVIAGDWLRARREALKHETLRQIIEKTGQIDQAQLQALFQPPTPGWLREPPPGSGYRTLRVIGTIVLSVALGLTVFFTVLLLSSPARYYAMIGFACASAIAVVGMGFFFASRFLPAPPPSDRGDHT
jgi:hypothetical protein